MARKWVIPRPVRRFVLLLWTVGIVYVSTLAIVNFGKCYRNDFGVRGNDPSLRQDEDLQSNESVILQAKTFLTKRRIFFYNRAPKCGSRSVLGVFQYMKGLRHIHSTVVAHHYLSQEEQEDVIHRLQVAPPVVYDRHVPMINFTKFGFPNPIYINVVREPLSHFKSHFNFRRHGSRATQMKIQKGLLGKDELERLKMDMDTCVRLNSTECGVNDSATGTLWIRKNIPFFLGQDIHLRNTTSAHVAVAKRNAHKYYAVVGIVEDLPTFFETLGYLFPDVFKNASTVYNETGSRLQEATSTKVREQASKETLDILKYRLRFEYDFYYFIKSRIYTLHYYLENNGGKL